MCDIVIVHRRFSFPRTDLYGQVKMLYPRNKPVPFDIGWCEVPEALLSRHDVIETDYSRKTEGRAFPVHKILLKDLFPVKDPVEA